MAEKDIKEKFARDVQDALAKTEKRGSVFNAGKPHPVFIKNGLPDKPIMVSPAIIRKARKKSQYNDHCVKQADLERLPELLENPVALLKSLTSQNKFVVVLDAKDEKNRPVVVAINSTDKTNTIDSVYGRENFDLFIKRSYEAGAVLAVNKNKAIEGVWAYQQYQGETAVNDFQEPVYQQFKNMSSAKIESKENIMAEIKIEDREEARGFVQGVCESAVVVAQKDVELSRKILGTLGVTKELSKKFAEPETFKALEKNVFTVKKIEREQTLERGRGIGL